MFSDPIENSSSDIESFDEDDMYGTDSEIESIPLNASRQRRVSEPEHDFVCVNLVANQSVLTHDSGPRHYPSARSH